VPQPANIAPSNAATATSGPSEGGGDSERSETSEGRGGGGSETGEGSE